MLKQMQGGVCAAKGFTANGVHCGIRKNKTKRDLQSKAMPPSMRRPGSYDKLIKPLNIFK